MTSTCQTLCFYSPPAHPERALRDLLLFAAEDDLDRAVQTEPLLYDRFQQVYRRLLEETLTAEHLEQVFARVEAELESIDTGQRARRARRFRARRAQAIRDFERWLLDRRAALLAFLPAADGGAHGGG